MSNQDTPTNTIDNKIDEDWLDKVLEQYWKQRHGMYNANQDDVEMANREAKDAIANKVVELILKDRTAINKTIMEDLLAIVGEDIPIYVNGKQVKDGDPMEIDLSGGTSDPRFRESCRNIQDNGKNMEKYRIRQAVTKKYGRADNELDNQSR